MKFNMKVLLSMLLLGVVFMVVNFLNKCNDLCKQDNNFYRDHLADGHQPQARDLNQFPDDSPQDVSRHGNDKRDDQSPGIPYEEVDCLINDEYTVGCRKEGEEVFLPFSFIAKYFEVYGKLERRDGVERFEWHHSYSKVYAPKTKYTPDGIFMSFEHYNVEVRDRVKCISATEGVPISTQWGPQGYHYPIQIAQYGLSHYSKYLIDKSRKMTIIEDAEEGTASQWTVSDRSASISNVLDPETQSRVIEFNSDDSIHSAGVTLPINSRDAGFFLAMDFKFVTNGSITVTVEIKGKQVQLYYIHYVWSHSLIDMVGNEVYYGLGDWRSPSGWRNVHRDLSTDLQKGLLLLRGATKRKKVSLARVLSVTVRGRGLVDNVTLSTNAHLAQFYDAANWLVLHQDERGGWPIYVTRKLASGKLELPPGWYSAMAQGQAMSLLVRAYLRTENAKYLDAAVKATRLLDVPSADGGVLATFADRYPWYEEYPTTPHSFVLNGFIYSLLGLYDLKTVASSSGGPAADAERLYRAGLNSLLRMLPLYDTGSGSIYDLRHFTLGTAPNLARWDYHATHINQLLLLSTIEPDPIFSETAKRWIGYMNGQRAAHN